MENVKFTTANGLIGDTHPFIYFPDDELYYRYLHAFNSIFVREVNLESRDKLFTCLNRADKLWRKVFCSTMHSLNLFDSSYFSYTGFQYDMPNLQYHIVPTLIDLQTPNCICSKTQHFSIGCYF